MVKVQSFHIMQLLLVIYKNVEYNIIYNTTILVKRVSTGKLIPFLKAAPFFVVIDQSLPNTVILEHLLISCDMSEGKHFPV